MTDKSFGDHLNRNIVKNPLLSTAVVGLSVEDLTHNAVLVPVVQTAGAVTAPDQQFGSQTRSLENTDNVLSHYPSGDANSNLTQPTNPQTNPYQHDIKETDKKIIQSNLTQSNALLKSDDDFDVNEYFARLQGTRYVSAPLNSIPDHNANLEEKEENLEEINLNEPETSNKESEQQSLTADIAQNFSQLPQVLPQVASAVFSSFSSMLYKSREQTPDEKGSGYQVEFERSEEVKELIPPPREPPREPLKEPPIGGPGNYRLATKKKYAQLPGLTTDTRHIFNPTANIAQPYYPEQNFTNYNPTQEGYAQFNVTQVQESNINLTGIDQSISKDIQDQAYQDISKDKNQNQTYHIFTPTFENIPIDNAKITKESNVNEAAQFSTIQDITIQQPIIPPPPMFSNVPRTSQSGAGKSVLPPSVARRIAGNQPVFKTPPIAPAFTDNIFIPTLPEPENAPSAFAPFTSSTKQSLASGSQPLPPQPQVPEIAPISTVALSSPFYTQDVPSPTPGFTAETPLTDTILTGPVLPPIGVPVPPKTAKSCSVGTSSDSSQRLTDECVPSQQPWTIPSGAAAWRPPMSAPNISPMPITALQNIPPKATVSASAPDVTPPTFFNPGAFEQPVSASPYTLFNPGVPVNTEPKPVIPNLLEPSQLNPNPEPPKSILEPPKIGGNVNYRMNKKRPQYYSGPIEGVGAISNNYKPVIPVEPSNTAFQGSLFTPPKIESVQQDTALYAPQDITPVPSEQSAILFDITRPIENLYNPQYEPVMQQDSFIQPDYNTAFDFSRPTTEKFEEKESKGFGLIGSLKSKLSSIDINKIQSSVTTFFDPGYNQQHKDVATQEVPYGHYGQESFGQNQSNFEIFVPNVETAYSQTSYQNVKNPYDQQYYAQQSIYNQDPDNPMNYKNQYSYTDTTATQLFPQAKTSQEDIKPDIPTVAKTADSIHMIYTQPAQNTDYKPIEANPKIQEKALFDDQNISQINTDKSTRSFFEKPDTNIQSILSDTNKLVAEMSELKVSEHRDIQKTKYSKDVSKIFDDEVEDQILETVKSAIEPFLFEDDNTKTVDLLSNISKSLDSVVPANTEAKATASSFSFKQDDYLKPMHDETIPYVPTEFASLPLYGLSTMLADKTQELSDLNKYMKNASLFEAPRDSINSMFVRKSSTTFFDNLSREVIEKKEAEDDSHDLNICETCREVDWPKDDDKHDDVTKQLIENITSPIQLLNAVEVPLPATNRVEEQDDFSNQCAEISLVTEETIETIQVQSVTELLDEEPNQNVRSYGWTDEPFQISKDIVDHDYDAIKPNLDHDYLKINHTNIGFIGDSLFSDNSIPTNASDEIKAEFKFTHDDSPLILPRQMSIPSAPPEEEDNKSDETGGLDVHLIEQDAKIDFFEEFVIEPSETDDDKIEYKVKERSSDEPAEVESFTSRVERFKQMGGSSASSEDHKVDNQKSPFDLPTSTSPAITIASYFDTGNYAVETHYRNSLTSPNVTLTVGSPTMRVPPGFEEQYRKLSGVSSIDLHGNKPDLIPQIPDCHTQTRPVGIFTYSTAKADVETCQSSRISQNLHNTKSDEIDKLTDFNTGVNDDVSTLMTEDKVPSLTTTTPELLNLFTTDIKPIIPMFATIGDNKDLDSIGTKDTSKESSVIGRAEAVKHEIAPTLSDPINFFSTEITQSEDNNFNRLASYFGSPPKTDQTKSFFELSQSQDHYRQPPKPETKTPKSFFELSQGENLLDPNPNISQERYLANVALINDLTSYQNPEFKPENVVKTVNYFTVEYDNENLNLPEFNRGEPDHKKANLTEKLKSETNSEETVVDDKTAITIVKKCKTCNVKSDSDVNLLNVYHEIIVPTVFKVKKCLDSDTTEKRDNDTMDINRDNATAHSITVDFDGHPLDEESNDGVTVMHENRSSTEYAPVKHHWFYRVDVEGKSIWRGFSYADSRALEEAYHSADLNENTLVPTDGGRFDVNVLGRLRIAVYWTDKPANVRRCSWFYKGTTDPRYVPYTEVVADKLEEEYRHGMTTGEWHRRLILPNSEMVVMHGPSVMVHFLQGGATDAFSSPTQSTMRPRVVRRGHDESEIEDTEPSSIDHLLLLCHGVGSACDMRFRSVEEVVEDFRATSLQLLQSHYRNAYDSGVVGRIEVLPISWHASLHGGEAGVDRRLARITLDSIPRLRNFTNDTVLDVLFYTSPVFCQTIIDTVCTELNRIYKLFCSRNPDFKGDVSLGGHSLGSVILYDLLCHQAPTSSSPGEASGKTYVMGSAGTGQPCVQYPKLDFYPATLYALGSPIAIFECIRGVETLGTDFRLPTCRNFFNIFHPYDPIAYRIEPLINPALRSVKPYLIPHHKGRKRMHLELKDTMARVGADIKQKLIESIKTTWSNMWKSQPPPSDMQLEKVVEEEIEKEQLTDETKNEEQNNETNSRSGYQHTLWKGIHIKGRR